MLLNDFHSGWQNKARTDLMNKDAVMYVRDARFDKLGSVRPRRSCKEDSYFKGLESSHWIRSLYMVDVEGVGKRLVFYMANGVVYCYNTATGVTRTVATTVVANKFTYAAMKPSKSNVTYVYGTNGSTMFCDNGTTTKTWGIDPPGGSPWVTMAGSGGALSAGDYRYVYTFYDNQTGSESDPCGAGIAVTAAATDLATVSDIEVSTNSRAGVRRVYRTYANGGFYYLVRTLTGSASGFVDGTADSDLGIKLVDDQGIPPLASWVVGYNNRLFLCGSENYPNRVWFSRTNAPDNWPSTYYLEVGSSDDARAHVGALGKYTIASGPDGVYFLGPEGVYVFDGLKCVNISEPVGRTFGKFSSTWIDRVNWDLVDNARGCFWRGVYYVSLPLVENDEGTGYFIVSYDVAHKVWMCDQVDTTGWALWCDQSRDVLYGCVLSEDESYKTVVEMFSEESRELYPPSVEFVSREVDIPNECAPKGKGRGVWWLRKFRVDAVGDWTVYFYVDGTLVHTQAMTGLDASDRYYWYDLPGSTKGRMLQVKVVATGVIEPGSYEFKGIEVV